MAYSVKYRLSLDKPSHELTFFDTSVTGTDTGKGLIKVTSPLGNVIYKNSGYDAASFAAPDIDLPTTSDYTMVLPTTIEEGEYVVDYKVQQYDAGGTPLELSTTEKQFTYCYTSPVVEINYDILCDDAVLKSIDSSSYGAVNNSIALTPTSMTRNHKVEAPFGSGYGSIADTSDAIRTFANIWTKDWQTVIETVVNYSVQQWSDSDTALFFSITDWVRGSSTATVSCGLCYCALNECYAKLYSTWINSMKSGGAVNPYLQRDVLRVTNLYTQYLQAERCGDADTDKYCNLIAEILIQNECDCNISSDEPSKLVSSTTSASGSDGAKILFGTVAPTTGVGADGDMYVDNVAWNVYQKASGSWVLKGNIKGAKGDKGDTGAKGDKGDKGDTGDNATPKNFMAIPLAFIAKEMGDANFVIPIDCTINHVYTTVTAEIESSDDGRIEIAKNGGAAIVTITVTRGSSYGTQITAADVNTAFTAGDNLSIATSKTTPNGRVTLVIEYTKS